MNQDQRKKTISDANSEIKKLETLISDLQRGCNHDKSELKNVGATTANIKLVCTICETIVGVPNNDELKKAGYI